MFKESVFNNFPPVKKEESVLRKQENMIALFRKLQNVYSARPDIKDFTNAMADTKYANDYSPEKIAEDADYIKTKRNQIDVQNSSRGQELLDNFEENFAFAEAAQAMITDRLNSWLPDFKTIMTSDFDDLKVGIDMVMKHQNGGYLGTAFDATVSSNEEKINQKLEKNWTNNITRGNVPVVKYFQDPDTEEKGRILVPKFIIGASANDVNEMAKAYLSDNEESLDNHPFRMLVLDQIKTQIDGALDFYEKNNDPRYSFSKQQHLKVKKMIDEARSKLVESQKIDRLDYHEYHKNNLTTNLIEKFFDKKNN